MSKNPFVPKNNLIKIQFIIIFILGIIIFSPSINTSLARENPGVEIKEGEEYSWVLKFNISNFIELVEDTGQGTVSTEMVALNLQGDTGLTLVEVNLEIIDISDGFIIDSFFDVTITLVEGVLTIAPDFNISKIPIFYPLNFSIQNTVTPVNFSILKGDTLNYFSIPIGFFLIVATDLNFTTAAMQLQTQIQEYYLKNFGITNSRVDPQDSSLRITHPADTNIGAAELTLNYNSKGILKSAIGNYGGPTLFAIEYSGGGGIAFEFPLFLSVFTLGLVTLMFRKRKKFKISS
jgi:hypothetical protein